MAKERLGKATFVERGYGQVEPNHLSAQRTGQIYAQLPAAASIELLENGQFVKYNYKDGVVDFSGKGEWMLVFNEVKVYREWESDQDFAMRRENYVARVYSPIDGTLLGVENGEQLTQPRYYGGQDAEGHDIPKVTTPADPYEWDATDNPFAAEWDYKGPKKMPENTKMVPRVLKTNVGDIFTTNCIMASTAPAIGAEFAPSSAEGSEGYLAPVGENDTPDMVWQVVKVYDLGDRQRAVKLMRIK
jgi:hypothetical protein